MLHYFLKPIKKFRRSYLPGIVTASADDDPSSISTYSVAGATTGFSQLWLIFVATPLLITVHKLTACIGDVTKKGLITLIKENFGRRAALFCLLAVMTTNLLTLIADIIGMAAGLQLLTGESYIYFIIPLIILLWYIIVFDNYPHIARYFFWFSGILVAYIFAGFLAKPDWTLVVKSIFAPQIKFTLGYAAAGLGLLGATFSPYAFFWQTKEEIEERHTVKDIKQTSRAVVLGFMYSNIISFFIMIAAAKTAFGASANFLTISDIAKALEPLAGGIATKLFGIGLLGSGILAIPVLAATSAYTIAEYFGWPGGLNRQPRRAKGFYSIISAGFLISLAALFLKLQPLKVIFYSQVLVGILTPPLIYYILKIAGSRKIMGQWRARWLSLALGWLTIALLLAGDALLVYLFFQK